MSLLPTIGAVDQDTGFYNGVITTSLVLNSGSSHHLHRTPSGNSSDTDKKKYTFSTWIKRTKLGTTQQILAIGSAAGGAPWFFLYFLTSDKIQAYWYSTTSGNATNSSPTFAPVFRDTSAWYNIVLVVDTTDDTPTDRFKLYVNGVRVAVETAGNALLEDFIGVINSTSKHWIGRNNNDEQYLDGYLAETIMVDGTAIGETSGYLDEFGELKNGVWIPKDYTGSYGTNGFRLKYTGQEHDDTASEGSADANNVAADSSGSNHHWIAGANIDTNNCAMPDSPENNFCTLNSLDKGSEVTLSEGNLGVSWSSNSGHAVRSSFTVSSGKWYAEFRRGASSATIGIAKQNNTGVSASSGWLGSSAYGSGGSYSYSSDANKYTNGSNTSYGASYASGDIIGVAYDADNGTITFYKNGSSQGQAYSGISGEFAFGIGFFGGSTGGQIACANFGQDSSFAGDETATSNSDANGNGTFHSAVPSGYLALCTANLEEPVIGPNSDTQATDHFNTLIYNGNDDATRTFDVGFVSDWSWFKARNANGIGHQLYDSSRGVQKYLASNTTGDESDNTEGVTSFNSSGLLAIGNSNFLNKSGRTHVIWNWKANGGTTTTNDASATSIGDRDSVIQANTTAGFSIVLYTGSGQTGAGNDDTYRHGLQVNGEATTPELIICKNRDTTDDWLLGATAIPSFNWANDYMHWNEAEQHQTNANRSAFSVTPTDTVFSVGEFLNKANNYVAYLFASVKGYSKIGVYTGTGSTSGTAGPYVFTGFRPAWIMTKRVEPSDNTGSWWILDSKRDPFNEALRALQANLGDQETAYSGNFFDFYSNGFAPRTSGVQVNGSGKQFLYMAFAEAPFKYANAR